MFWSSYHVLNLPIVVFLPIFIYDMFKDVRTLLWNLLKLLFHATSPHERFKISLPMQRKLLLGPHWRLRTLSTCGHLKQMDRFGFIDVLMFQFHWTFITWKVPSNGVAKVPFMHPRHSSIHVGATIIHIRSALVFMFGKEWALPTHCINGGKHFCKPRVLKCTDILQAH